MSKTSSQQRKLLGASRYGSQPEAVPYLSSVDTRAKPNLRLPMHLDPDDYTPGTCHKRYVMHTLAAYVNPKGYRQMQTKRIGSRKDKKNRLTRLCEISSTNP